MINMYYIYSLILSLIIFIILDKKDKQIEAEQFATFFAIYLVSTFILYVIFNSMDHTKDISESISTGLKMV